MSGDTTGIALSPPMIGFDQPVMIAVTLPGFGMVMRYVVLPITALTLALLTLRDLRWSRAR